MINSRIIGNATICEGLVQQLHLLRCINTRLSDDQDMRDYGNSPPADCAQDAAELRPTPADHGNEQRYAPPVFEMVCKFMCLSPPLIQHCNMADQ